MKRLLGRLTRTATDSENPLRRMPAPPTAELDLFRTLSGRLFMLSGGLWLVLWLANRALALPELVEVFRKVVSVAFIGSTIVVAAMAISKHRHTLLWRVRRKLILSYVFLGVVPVMLVVLFVLSGGFILYTSAAAYLFHEGFEDVVSDIHEIAATAAAEIAAGPDQARTIISRKYQLLSDRFRPLSLAVVPMSAPGGRAASRDEVVVAGSWKHLVPPARTPAWIGGKDFSGTLLVASTDSEDPRLLIRAVVPMVALGRAVIADLPVDTDVAATLDDQTGARILRLSVSQDPARTATSGRPGGADLSLFRRTVVYMDFVDWERGQTGSVAVGLEAPFNRLYSRMASVRSLIDADQLLAVLVVLGVLFLIIQSAAVVYGAVLGRSITYAVHALYTGTERIREGDFAHRISIESKDQLGDLADSFNRMSASIAHLLHVQREKQRLDDELRIAREIQQSLLPLKLPAYEGLSLADWCEPAREVGGDYYDFFEIGPRLLGVLIADVSGKGTSAALYMAELKGMMLALSRNERSPRRLLIEANRLLADHLDNRSFITVTYAVIDLEARTLTCARAGHTPLLVASGGRCDVVVPEGMVLGLRLPGATELFADVLQEHTRPLLPGDVVVFYTDGITEAMDERGELFGDAALADVVCANLDLDATGIRERVLRDVKAFVGDAEPHDDMTMIVMKFA